MSSGPDLIRADGARFVLVQSSLNAPDWDYRVQCAIGSEQWHESAEVGFAPVTSTDVHEPSSSPLTTRFSGSGSIKRSGANSLRRVDCKGPASRLTTLKPFAAAPAAWRY